MIIKDIRAIACPWEDAQPTRCIDNFMIRGINDRSPTLKKLSPIPIHIWSIHILRSSNPNFIPTQSASHTNMNGGNVHILLRGKAMYKLTTLAMTKPEVIIRIPVTHK